MQTFEVWDVVRLPFPYLNRPVEQRRPALVLAVIVQEGAPMFLWVAMITSAGNRPWPDDVAITDLASAGLPSPSVIRTAKLATAEVDVATRLGRLGREDRARERAHVHRYLEAALHRV